MDQAGFPPGVVNMVTGLGRRGRHAIVENPDVNVISFTGNGETGRDIADRGARRLKRLSLELGGKNAIVVMADADLDLAVDGILWSAFGTTGQRCTACSRVVVDRSAWPTSWSPGWSSAPAGLRLGTGLDEAVDVGPLINAGRWTRSAATSRSADDEGARLVAGGEQATDGDLRTATSSSRRSSTASSR